MNSVRETLKKRVQNDYGGVRRQLSLFPHEVVLTREIETWRDFIDKLPSDEDKFVLTKLLNDCYKYSVAMNKHVQTHPFPTESLILALLLSQHKVIHYLESIIKSNNPKKTTTTTKSP